MRRFSRFLANVSRLLSSDQKTRYEAKHALLTAVANGFGFRVYNRHLMWPTDKEYTDTWKRFPEATPIVHDRRFVMYSAARSVRHIRGDTAECGVWRGASSMMILASQEGVPDKTHHVFDSFEGLSEPDARDKVDSSSVTYAWRKHDLSVGEEIVQRNLSAFQNFRMYRGWIPARFNEVADRRFSFVHIDVDLYQPTFDSLAFFYPRMSPGGIIICDDYGFTTCPGAHDSFEKFLEDKPESVIHLTTGQGLLVKQG